jgi:alpha-galactosidase/6-phospho-beta-glucosidase family protein
MKLAVIGGGSSQWMISLMKDIYLLDAVDGGEIRLVDPDRPGAEAVAKMLARFNQTRGKDFSISVCDDRSEALHDADFVMTTFSPGSMDAFDFDLEVPIRYGIRQPVSMTVGPAGISAALRTAPVAAEIVADMERECPQAWLLNVTNPMSVVTRAMNQAARQVRVLGLCHEFHSFSKLAKAILGLQPPPDMNVVEQLYHWMPEQGLNYTVAGINHFIWITSATLHGEDVLPRIRRFAREHRDLRAADAPYTLRNAHGAKLALCRTFGYLPVVGDRHLVEFWPHLCNLRNGFGMRYSVEKTTVDSRRHRREDNRARVERIAAGEEEMKWSRSGEEMTEIMRCVLTGDKTTAILNLPNQGQVANLPADVIVETLATVDGSSVQPHDSGDLPGSVASLCRLHVDVQELTVRAALEGSRELLVEALSLDPLSGTGDFGEMGDLADELLLATREWLPRFFKD